MKSDFIKTPFNIAVLKKAHLLSDNSAQTYKYSPIHKIKNKVQKNAAQISQQRFFFKGLPLEYRQVIWRYRHLNQLEQKSSWKPLGWLYKRSQLDRVCRLVGVLAQIKTFQWRYTRKQLRLWAHLFGAKKKTKTGCHSLLLKAFCKRYDKRNPAEIDQVCSLIHKPLGKTLSQPATVANREVLVQFSKTTKKPVNLALLHSQLIKNAPQGRGSSMRPLPKGKARLTKSVLNPAWYGIFEIICFRRSVFILLKGIKGQILGWASSKNVGHVSRKTRGKKQAAIDVAKAILKLAASSKTTDYMCILKGSNHSARRNILREFKVAQEGHFSKKVFRNRIRDLVRNTQIRFSSKRQSLIKANLKYNAHPILYKKLSKNCDNNFKRFREPSEAVVDANFIMHKSAYLGLTPETSSLIYFNSSLSLKNFREMNQKKTSLYKFKQLKKEFKNFHPKSSFRKKKTFKPNLTNAIKKINKLTQRTN